MDMFDEKVEDNEGLELDRFIYLMGELIENIFVHRSMCKVMGYNMDTVDGFIAKKWAIEKDRFDKMTVEELCRIIGEDTRRGKNSSTASAGKARSESRKRDSFYIILIVWERVEK